MTEKRMIEEFIDKNIEEYNIFKKYDKDGLISITIKGGQRGKNVYIYNEYYLDNVKDNDDVYVFGMNALEEAIKDRPDDIKDMILYFLEKGAIKEYFYYDFGEGKCIEKIPSVKNLEEWEEKQLIPILVNFEIFGVGSEGANLRQCNHLIKGCKTLEFIADVIDEYGYIRFGNVLEIGKIEMTDKEYEGLKELW